MALVVLIVHLLHGTIVEVVRRVLIWRLIVFRLGRRYGFVGVRIRVSVGAVFGRKLAIHYLLLSLLCWTMALMWIFHRRLL